ncbi:hypothetical protein [Shouchella miscanthi]|uniref:hypothetical protein n=1 Tax=Shouchella miscanthi TaxID=2598861 RepID=UPI0011AA0DB1|nr:hypothetical protein [Shouchella miscanthi]
MSNYQLINRSEMEQAFVKNQLNQQEGIDAFYDYLMDHMNGHSSGFGETFDLSIGTIIEDKRHKVTVRFMTLDGFPVTEMMDDPPDDPDLLIVPFEYQHMTINEE